MKRIQRFCIGTAAALVILHWAAPAQAQFVDEDPVGRLTIGGTIGVVTSSMGDINDNLRVVDEFLIKNEGVRKTDKVNTSILTALDIRYKLFDSFTLGFAWGALSNRSEFTTSVTEVRFYSRVTTYSLNAFYHFPGVTNWNERMQLYAGPGLVLLQGGYAEWRLTDLSINNFVDGNPTDPDGNMPPGREPPAYGDVRELSGQGNATGSGMGINLMVGSSYQFNARFSAAVDFGFRFAKLSDLAIANVEGFIERPDAEPNPDGPQEREPGDWAIWDFFLRDPDATLPDGRNRRDPRVPPEFDNGTGCGDCPLYYQGGAAEIDYSGLIAQISFRVHF